jgi:hypothetical protein
MFYITYEVIGNDTVHELEYSADEKFAADKKFDELKKTPNLQNLTMYQVVRYCSVTD